MCSFIFDKQGFLLPSSVFFPFPFTAARHQYLSASLYLFCSLSFSSFLLVIKIFHSIFYSCRRSVALALFHVNLSVRGLSSLFADFLFRLRSVCMSSDLFAQPADHMVSHFFFLIFIHIFFYFSGHRSATPLPSPSSSFSSYSSFSSVAVLVGFGFIISRRVCCCLLARRD